MNRWSPQVLNVLFEFWVIEIFPLLVYIFLVKVVFHGRNEGGAKPFLVKVLPREISQPRVGFNLECTSISQSVGWLSLDHLVYEVSRLDAPSSGHLSFLYLNLLGEDVVSYLLSRLADVRSAPIHALVSHHSDSEIVDGSCVILAAHDLRRHVAWCA